MTRRAINQAGSQLLAEIKQHQHTPKGKYIPAVTAKYFFVAKHGRAYDSTTPFTPKELQLIKRLRGRFRFTAKQCYRNSQRTIIENGARMGFRYAEGFACATQYGNFEHAWLVLRGKVVDFTLDREAHEYFGVEVPTKILYSFCAEGEVWGPITESANYRSQLLRPAAGSSPS